MIGVTHLFGCNENKPIDGPFSHRPQPPPTPLHILSLYPTCKWQTDRGSGDIAAASGREGLSVRVCVGVCVCADVSACHFAYTADVYDGAVSAVAHQLINLC